MTKAERDHISRVVAMGCAVCKYGLNIEDTPAEAHHIRAGTGKMRASHYEVIPLCPQHHRLGLNAIHVMGVRAWERYWQFTEADLLEKIQRS